jgi:hypothetical protein
MFIVFSGEISVFLEENGPRVAKLQKNHVVGEVALS